MTHYLRFWLLLLLLPAMMAVGRPLLRGSPLDPGHSVDLGIPLLVQSLLQSFLDRNKENQALYGGY